MLEQGGAILRSLLKIEMVKLPIMVILFILLATLPIPSVRARQSHHK